MSWTLTRNLILVPYWILESFVENRATLILSKTASVCVFSGSDGCRPDLRFSWKPSPNVDDIPKVIVSKIRRKPGYGLGFIVVWSWVKKSGGAYTISAEECRNCAWFEAGASDTNFGRRLPKLVHNFGRRLPKLVTERLHLALIPISADNCRNMQHISAEDCRNVLLHGCLILSVQFRQKTAEIVQLLRQVFMCNFNHFNAQYPIYFIPTTSFKRNTLS